MIGKNLSTGVCTLRVERGRFCLGNNIGSAKHVRAARLEKTYGRIDLFYNFQYTADRCSSYIYRVSNHIIAPTNMILISLIIYFTWSYRIDYTNGHFLTKMSQADKHGGLAPAVTAAGGVFQGDVFPGYPIEEFAPDGTFIGNAIDAADVPSYGRTLEVSADGNTIFLPRYPKKNIYIWTRPDEFSAFALTDSIYGFACESIVWHPVTGKMWASAGSYNDLPVPGMGLTPGTHYELDVTVNALGKVAVTKTDSIKWQFVTAESADERPRGIGFSPDGNTAYITCFGSNYYPSIQKFTKDGTGVWQPAGIIDGYTLSQNYPNPFNPTTTIRYSVGRSGMTTLKVFDLTGREVAELVNEHKAEGTYEVEFDATNLPSGTYIYELRSGHKVMTNRLTVSK